MPRLEWRGQRAFDSGIHAAFDFLWGARSRRVSGSDPSDHDTDLTEAIQEINVGTDRVCAIVGAALIEETLEEAIRRRLGDFEKLYREDEEVENKDYLGVVSKALGVNSFIGSLDTKIKMAYLLGIVGREGKANMATIANIRNKFAHRKHYRNFDDERLKELFKGLTLYKRAYRLPMSKYGAKPVSPLPENATRRQRFLHTVAMLVTAVSFRSLTFEDAVVMHDPPVF